MENSCESYKVVFKSLNSSSKSRENKYELNLAELQRMKSYHFIFNILTSNIGCRMLINYYCPEAGDVPFMVELVLTMCEALCSTAHTPPKIIVVLLKYFV
jgi:hypothetical protein